MNQNPILDYVFCNIDRTTVKAFCDKIIGECEEDIVQSTRIHVVSSRFLSNGYMSAIKYRRKYRFVILLNIHPFLKDNTFSQTMKWFHIYAIILHEIRHIELLVHRRLKSDYLTFLSIMEEEKRLIPLIYSRIVNLTREGRKIRKRSYCTSSVEMLCRYDSFQKAITVFRPLLQAEEIEVIENLIDAMKFLNSYMEIGYTLSGSVFNKFIKSVFVAQRSIKKKENFLEEVPFLSYAFNTDGTIKGFDILFNNRQEENIDFMDNIILRLFIYLAMDFKPVVQNNKVLKDYLEGIGNQYCGSVLYYYDHIQLGTLLLDHNVLEDNSITLFKNSEMIGKIMDDCGMRKTEGGIFVVQ